MQRFFSPRNGFLVLRSIGRRHIANRVNPNVLRYRASKASYPSNATDLILGLKLPSKGLKIMDLCARNGEFTSIIKSYFMGRSTEIIAVESNDDNMQTLKDKFNANDNIKVVKGSPLTLNEIPSAKSLDVIFCAQSFHHFATQRCVDQIFESVKLNGYLFLIWNRQTFENNAFSQELKSEIIDKYDDKRNKEMSFEYQRNNILQLFKNKDNKTKFSVQDDGYITFPNSLKQRGDINMMIDGVCSIASISMRDEKERNNVIALVYELVNKHYGSVKKAQLTMDYDTDVIIAQKV